MKHRTTPILFTLLFGTVVLSGCASTGATPASDATATTPTPAPATTAVAVEEKKTDKKKTAAPGAEPECD